MTYLENEPIRILMADDHIMFIDGIKALLRKESNIIFAGEAKNGHEALNILERTPVDMLITDINMPEMSGIELTKEVKKRFPDVKILILTMFNDREIISEIIRSEAEGYILKNTGKNELISAIKKISDHGTFYSNDVLDILKGDTHGLRKESYDSTLTKREVEIVQLIAREFSSMEIADKLFISPRTVDTHRKNIMNKTGSKTLVGLIRYAIQCGLVDFNQINT